MGFYIDTRGGKGKGGIRTWPVMSAKVLNMLLLSIVTFTMSDTDLKPFDRSFRVSHVCLVRDEIVVESRDGYVNIS